MAVQLKYGSQGDDVKILQRTLNENGDNLVVDGVFGKDTQKSVMKFQEDKGLAIDGIVGDETQNALYGNNATGGTSNYTPTAAPTINPTPTAPTYDTSTWDESEKGSAAGEAYEAAKNALSTYGDFVFSENEWLNSVKDSIQNYGGPIIKPRATRPEMVVNEEALISGMDFFRAMMAASRALFVSCSSTNRWQRIMA